MSYLSVYVVCVGVCLVHAQVFVSAKEICKNDRIPFEIAFHHFIICFPIFVNHRL